MRSPHHTQIKTLVRFLPLSLSLFLSVSVSTWVCDNMFRVAAGRQGVCGWLVERCLHLRFEILVGSEYLLCYLQSHIRFTSLALLFGTPAVSVAGDTILQSAEITMEVYHIIRAIIIITGHPRQQQDLPQSY